MDFEVGTYSNLKNYIVLTICVTYDTHMVKTISAYGATTFLYINIYRKGKFITII